MVVLNKIYTKTGDDGTTALGDGKRVKKHDLRVVAYGSVDETNAALGIARLHIQNDPQIGAIDHTLARIQNDLFDAGADLCVPEHKNHGDQKQLRISAAQVEFLENEIDGLTQKLEPLRSFVLPGGSLPAAHLHMARTVCRRAERNIIELAQQEGEWVNPLCIQYINRLSDLLFVLARYANNSGKSDCLWKPGENH